MTSITIINIVSKLWAAILNIILIPLYVKFLGAESYGLVAFYGVLLGSLAILDVGLSPTLSREIAIHKAKKVSVNETCDLVFTIESIYWLISIIIGFLVFFLSYPIAAYWVNSKELSIATIEKAVILMGAVIVFQWPTGLYNGALIGLEKQKVASLIYIAFASLRSLGVLAILYFSPTIEAYFYWQLLATFFFSLSLRYFVWHYLSDKLYKPKFSKIQLMQIWKFAAGMAGISFVTFFISQIDKILVSKFLPLEQVGYYSIAFSVAGGLSMLSGSLAQIIYPKLTKIVASGQTEDLVEFYHNASKWMSILSLPVGLFLIIFAPDILIIWTKNQVLTQQVTPILRIAALGTLFNNMMTMPYYLMLANGETRYTIYQNLIVALLSVPLLIWGIFNYGALGASFIWLSVNAGYIFISVPLVYRKFLKGELWKWYLKDIALPLIKVMSILICLKILMNFVSNKTNLIELSSFLVISLLLCFISISESRNLIIEKFKIYFYAIINNYTH